MVLPKSTFHVSRLASTALKSFTHGYAQTVVAASQSSYASQNTPVAPLASNFLSRFKENNDKVVGQHAHFSTVSAGQQQGVPATKVTSHHDAHVAHLHDAWHKHAKNDGKDRHAVQSAKRVGWKPPTVFPGLVGGETTEQVSDERNISRQDENRLKRSYSTSAVDNFAKAIDNEVAEAIAIAHVNEEIAKVKKDVDIEPAAGVADIATLPVADQSATVEKVGDSNSFATNFHTAHLQQLLENGHYDQIPAAFQSMLRDGISRPSQAAYRALLASAIHVPGHKNQRTPRILDIYSDMVRRDVRPDNETLNVIIDVLAARAEEAATTAATLTKKHNMYGPLASTFTFELLESKMATSDQTLSIVFRLIATAPTGLQLSADVYTSLIKACAERGYLSEMTDLYNASQHAGVGVASETYPTMITAFGKVGDLRSAVGVYDDYRDLAILNNSGANTLRRIDAQVYATLVRAYGQSGSIEKGKKLLARIEVDEVTNNAVVRSRDAILTDGLLPFELQKGNMVEVYAIVNGLSPMFYGKALEQIVMTSADRDDAVASSQAFDALADFKASLTAASISLLAMHIRAGRIQSGERYFSILSQAPATLEIMQLAALRAIVMIQADQAVEGLRSARLITAKYAQMSINHTESAIVTEHVEEVIEALSKTVFRGSHLPISVEACSEVLRTMNDSGVFLAHHAESMLSSMNASSIDAMSSVDLDVCINAQARLILTDSPHDVATPARFTYMLESVVNRSILPDVATENAIEKALVNLDRSDLTRLWNNHRYASRSEISPVASTPVGSTISAFSPQSSVSAQPSFDDSFDPYMSRSDQKGSIAITDILEKTGGRPATVLTEALAKFKNIRRAGRHPKYFAYAKLIQAASKAGRLDTAKEILELAKQDVPYLGQYRLVQHGWVGILDAMVAAYITAGRRDLAAKFHQDLLDIGAAPSANTFGLYITSLKETTKTFDEASEAVQIFLRSRQEGVEPTSFLYNALIGKLGKARRIDDCLFYFAEMRNLGIRPTSVTYGTIVNALCRVSDEKFAEEIFEEMEASTNYKPRPAPYHSLMQFFLTTKCDRSKVLDYHQKMRKQNIEPTMHTFKLLIDAYATLEPVNMAAAEGVLQQMRQSGVQPEAVHYASLIHAKGCVLHDMQGARALFDQVVADPSTQLQPSIYQALFESLVANKQVLECDDLLQDMKARRIELTPYIANALIHGWTMEKNIAKAQAAFNMVDRSRREPSTYEAMVRAHLAVNDHAGAAAVVAEALSRGYPNAVALKISELVAGGLQR